MSGRSGYRKTGRRQNRDAQPAPKSDYVLRFQLPRSLAFAIAPGRHGWGVTVGFNDVVYAAGRHPLHCERLAIEFLEGIGARRFPQVIGGSFIKLLPCPAHSSRQIIADISDTDLEVFHDRISRNAARSRPCSIVVAAESIIVTGPLRKNHDDCSARGD